MIRWLKRDGRRGAAVLASARSRAERVRPRGAVQRGQDRADRHRAASSRSQVLGGGYHVEVEADGDGLAAACAASPGVQAVDQAGRGRATGCWPTATCARRRRPCVVDAGGSLTAALGRTSRASTRSTRAISEETQPRPRSAACGVKARPWRGLGVVFFSELFDHLTSARMLVLELLVVLLRRARWSISPPSRSATPPPKTRSCSCGCSRRRASRCCRSCWC